MSSKTIVIKLGTSSIVHETTHQPLLSILSSIVETVVALRSHGHRVVLVSSGAIGVGLKRMEIHERPSKLSGKQALAAIGQGRLIALWDNLFGQLGQPIAQILLTRGDISDRTRYLNAVNTFKELLSMGVVPIVNENDTVSVSEIKFGDNDTLSAITSSMIHADYLFLLTDVDGLYTANPRKDPSAKQIEDVHDLSAIRSQVSTSTMGSSLGTGGMETKLLAAEIATGAGTATVIMSSKTPSNVFSIISYHLDKANALKRPPHTLFHSSGAPLPDIKSWTAHTLHPSGSVIVDRGAHKVLSRRDSGGRLLAAGVLGVIGRFAGGVAVRICILREDDGAGAASGHVTPEGPLSRSISRGRSRDEPASIQQLDTAEQGESVFPSSSSPSFSEKDIIEVGRGLTNYNSVEINRLKGMKSGQIANILGYADSEYVVENVTIRVVPS